MADRLSIVDKIRLTGRVWTSFVRVHWLLRRAPLPEAIGRSAASGSAWWTPVKPTRIARLVARVLKVGPWRPRCLVGAMVLHRLLAEQGTDAQVVIGLPDRADDQEAHAWVEVDGVDLGPPPGRGVHEELARYPA